MTPDPRLALGRQRKVAIKNLATLRLWRASMCDCTHCGMGERIEEIEARIARAVEDVDELTEACSTRPVLVSG